MVRPRKSANASRDNGVKAKNKGKAKATVPVLSFAYNEHADITEVVTEQRARLPKGFVENAAQVESLQMATEAKKWDVSEKMSKLKKMIKGAPSTFAFKEPATAQPRDRPRRVRFSVCARACPAAGSYRV